MLVNVTGVGGRYVAGHHIKIISSRRNHLVLVAQKDDTSEDGAARFRDLKGARPSQITMGTEHDNYGKEASRGILKADFDGLNEVGPRARPVTCTHATLPRSS